MSERVEKGQLTRHRGQDEAHSIRAKATESQVRAGEGEEEQRGSFMWEQLGGEREGAERERGSEDKERGREKTRREKEERRQRERESTGRERKGRQGERTQRSGGPQAFSASGGLIIEREG